MELTMIAGGPCSTGDDDKCNAGDCPTVFATDQPDMLAVQGYNVARRTPDGESVVLLPEEVLKEAARARGWL
ncbi:hypothetical protein ACH492_16305 [Streptomyces sp. NPDC019443]|uniref:hypothetical protein n=1 Tax=Streptomyces sp. NPDC019443 TaxID=3365061 RepID=UPI0037B52015